MVDYDRVQDFLEARHGAGRVDPKREAALMLRICARPCRGEERYAHDPPHISQ